MADGVGASAGAWSAEALAAWGELCSPEAWPGLALGFAGAVPGGIVAQLKACSLAFGVARSVALLQEGSPAQAVALAERCAEELALPHWPAALTEGPALAAASLPPLPPPGATAARWAQLRATRLEQLAQIAGSDGDAAGRLTAVQFREWLQAPAEASVDDTPGLAEVACQMLRAGVAQVSLDEARAAAWRAYYPEVRLALETLRLRALAALERAAQEARRTDLRLNVALRGVPPTSVEQVRLEPFGAHQTVPVAIEDREAGRLSLRLRLTEMRESLGPAGGGMLRVTAGDRSRRAAPLMVCDRLAGLQAAAVSSSDGRLCVQSDLGEVAVDSPVTVIRVIGPDRGALAKLTVEGADAPLVRESLYHDFRTMETRVGDGEIAVELPTTLSLVRVAAEVRVWPAWREELYRREMELRATLAELSGAADGTNQSVRNAASGIMMQVRRAVAKGSPEGLREAVTKAADRLKVGTAVSGPRRDELLGVLQSWVDRVVALEMVRLENEANPTAATQMPQQVRVVSWLPVEPDLAGGRGSREMAIRLHVPPEPALPPADPGAVVTLEQAQVAMDGLLGDARNGQLAPAQYHAAARAWALAARRPEDWGNRTMVSSWLLANHSKQPLEELARAEVTPVYEQLKQQNQDWLREARALPRELAATLPEPVSQVFTTRGELGTDMPMPPGAAVVHGVFAEGLWRMTDPPLDLRPRYLLTHLDKYVVFYSQRLDGLRAVQRVLAEDYLPRVHRLVAGRLAHTKEVERLRTSAELVGLGARFDKDLTVPESDPAVRYLLLAQAHAADALEAVKAWERLTERQARWIEAAAQRAMEQGEAHIGREALLRAELQLRRTEQAAELLRLVEDAQALQSTLQPLVQTTQSALPGAPSATALPLDLAGAQWETVAAGLESWQDTLTAQLRAAAEGQQAPVLGPVGATDALPDMLAALAAGSAAASRSCEQAALQEIEIAQVVGEYHELERQVRSDPVAPFVALQGREALAALVDRNGRPTKEGDTEVRRVVDEHLLPRSWQTEFDGTWQPQVQKLRAAAEAFRRHSALFARAGEVHRQCAPVVVAGRARWSEKILPLAAKCHAAHSAAALEAAVSELYGAFDSRLGYSNEQRAAVLGERVPLPQVDEELLAAVAAAAAAYCEAAAPRLMASAAALRRVEAQIQALTADELAGHPWRERAQLELDLAAAQGEQTPGVGPRCLAWLEATLRLGGLETAAETLAAARQARAEAAGALEAAYSARFRLQPDATALASGAPAAATEG